MATDVLNLVSRVIDRAVEKSGYSAASGIEQVQAPDALVDMLASQLLGFVGMGGPAGSAGARPSVSELEQLCAGQAARNNALASALGACDCWGELAACEICRGAGASGWRRPNQAAFDALVRPLLRKMKQQRVGVRRASGLVR